MVQFTYKTDWGETYRWTLLDTSDLSTSRLLKSMLRFVNDPHLAFDAVDFDQATRQYMRERLLENGTPQARAAAHLFGFFETGVKR